LLGVILVAFLITWLLFFWKPPQRARPHPDRQRTDLPPPAGGPARDVEAPRAETAEESAGDAGRSRDAQVRHCAVRPVSCCGRSARPTGRPAPSTPTCSRSPTSTPQTPPGTSGGRSSSRYRVERIAYRVQPDTQYALRDTFTAPATP